MNEEQMRSIFVLSGIPMHKHWELVNKYWGDNTKTGPWWLVKTDLGLIRIGWRKRVIEINWHDTGIEAVVTEDDVTKSKSYVHAYSEIKAVEYLIALKNIHKRTLLDGVG